MTPTETAAVLRQLTDWRRGVDVDPPKPGEVFEAIDAAIAMFECIAATEKERDALRSKIAEMGRQEPVAEWLPLDSGEDTRRD